ncbi:MAG TPA: hypothetical protein RMH99_20945 [Sandaracinaceae bacterium LLY-WYZ-13_1]|nr:hypothetical protein [Sandaracinaceae bacterium LLY-WYZ-13_1]
MPVARPASRSLTHRLRRPRRRLSASVSLAGLVPVLLCLVLYELPFFEATGQCGCRPPEDLPEARHGTELPIAPVLRITPARVTLDHRTMGSTEALTRDLTVFRRSWDVLHPGAPFIGELLVEASRGVRYGALRGALEAADRAGFGRISFVVAQAPDPALFDEHGRVRRLSTL